MRIDVPDADVVDRITILEIKVERLEGEARQHCRSELETLRATWSAEQETALDAVVGVARLRGVNRALWEVEDALREAEGVGRFDDAFIASARSVYRLNDERALLKRGINEATGSTLVEQKSYV